MFTENVDYEKTGFRRYRLLKTFTYKTDIIPPKEIVTKFGVLKINGDLTLDKGFRWDGATGALDTPDIMKASCLHDWFCTAVENKVLPVPYRRKGDDLFYRVCLEEGMPKGRATYCHIAVVAYGKAKYMED